MELNVIPTAPRYLEARLRIEVGVGAFNVQGRPVQAEERNHVGVVNTGREGAGCDQVPVTIAFLPAQQSRHHGVSNAPNGLSKTTRDGISQRTGLVQTIPDGGSPRDGRHDLTNPPLADRTILLTKRQLCGAAFGARFVAPVPMAQVF